MSNASVALQDSYDPINHALKVETITPATPNETFMGQVGGNFATVAVELTRPTGTTAYAALDAISDSTSAPTVVFQFANLLRLTGGTGLLIKARLMTDQKTCTARFKLHLYRSAPTAINDNAPFTTLYANNAIRLGSIIFPACSTEDPTNSTSAQAIAIPGDGSNLPLEVSSATRDIYGLLETLDAFTPADSQKIYIGLSVDRN